MYDKGMVSFELLGVIASAIGNIFLGYFTYNKNLKSETNKYFFFFTFSLAAYLAFNYFALHQTADIWTFFWIKMTITIALIINLTFLLFMNAFPNLNLSLKPKVFWIALISTVIMIPLVQLNIVFTGIQPHTTQPIPGPGIALFLLHTFIFLGGGFFFLIKKFIGSSGVKKTQIKLLFLGAVFMFLSIVTTNLIFVVLLHTTQFVGLLPIYAVVFVSFISYAIVRHRFLDIGFVVARTVAYSLLITIMGLFYVVITYSLSSFFFKFQSTLNQLVIYAMITLVVALSFDRVRQVVERLTDKIFFKGHYDSNQLLSTLSNIMSSTIELKTLTNNILVTLISQMRISKGIIVLIDQGRIYDVVWEGYQHQPVYSFAQTIPFLYKDETIIFDELDEGPLKQLLRDMEFSVSKILKVKNEVIGLVLLGDKSSGDAYSEQDIKVINIFAPEAAVAIQNAQSYDKIKKFNVTLTQEIQKATSELQAANTKLQELDKLKDDFVSIASHELRTPMTAIRSYAWMALNRPDVPLSDRIKKYLSRTLISTERLINLVNDMLNISRIESGRVEISPKAFDMSTLVNDCLMEITARAKEKNLHLEMDTTSIPQVFADLDKVHQVLLNLLGNALKFTPTDGTIKVNFFTDGQFLETTVKDSGVGISKDDLSSLFKKFGRLDNSYVAAATSGGTGLGLFICKSLIELMGGKIWASSEGVGKGTSFTFSLPIATKINLSKASQFTNKVEGEAKILEPVAI